MNLTQSNNSDVAVSAYGTARSTVQGAPLSSEELREIDEYWLPLLVSELASRQQDKNRRRFPSLDYRLQEAMFLVERRISLSWMERGQTRMSTS
jgi:hypothetical protein